MEEFLKFYNHVKKDFWTLNIYHSRIVDWGITVGYNSTHSKNGETIIQVQNCDIEYVFAKAQVELKDWLLENEGGY
jgi:hypothetical protein